MIIMMINGVLSMYHMIGVLSSFLTRICLSHVYFGECLVIIQSEGKEGAMDLIAKFLGIDSARISIYCKDNPGFAKEYL